MNLQEVEKNKRSALQRPPVAKLCNKHHPGPPGVLEEGKQTAQAQEHGGGEEMKDISSVTRWR